VVNCLLEILQKTQVLYFSTNPFSHFDPERKIVVETNTSNLIVARVLSPYDNNILYPVAYFSRKHCYTKINYEIYGKLLTIIWAFKG
jgi:hypothetical protein